eukprot:COSAG04_NODE_595_length_12255_cov_246.957716_6_plen_64_part_00
MVDAKELNSWPSVMGTASCSCVRPILSTSANSAPFRRKVPTSSRISRCSERCSSSTAILTAVG